MAKKKCRCPPQPAGVPAWFMTYSDVITLLMTFFILLLTFASSEPEKFERMQVAVFGGGGASGVAGEAAKSVERDSITLRYRPTSARMTQRGSEMAPMDEEPANEAIARGLKSLDSLDELDSAERVSLEASLELLRNSDGTLTAYAEQQLRMIGIQLRSMPLEVELQAANPADAAFCIEMARFVLETQQIPPGRFSVSVAENGGPAANSIRILMTRTDGL